MIVGGGPAGAAAAIGLARAGIGVRLMERTTGPHDPVCGDFLSGPALAALAGLGIEPARLGGAAIDRVRVAHGPHVAEAALPFPARSLPRRILDEALLAAAAKAGACVLRGETVRTLSPGPAGVMVRLGGGHAVCAQRLLLATGKHDVRGAVRPGRRAGAIGLKAYVTLTAEQYAALAGAVELALLPGGYAGLQPVGDGEAVICLMLRSPRQNRTLPRPQDMLDWTAAASPHLRRRLAGASLSAAPATAVAGIPYGHLHLPAACQFPGLYRLGDQAAVIPSLVGDGIAIALASAAEAVRALSAGQDAACYHRRLRARLRAPMQAAMLVHRCAQTDSLQPWMIRACRLWPELIGFTASRTRCYQPPAALPL
jgi:menaquinone-9 beta-reductase